MPQFNSIMHCVDACASHPEHLAHFRLDPQHEVECSPPRIRFDMAFAQNLLEGRSHDADPVWFAIESMFNETLVNEPDIHPEEAKEAWCNFQNTFKRAIRQDSPPAVHQRSQNATSQSLLHLHPRRVRAVLSCQPQPYRHQYP